VQQIAHSQLSQQAPHTFAQAPMEALFLRKWCAHLEHQVAEISQPSTSQMLANNNRSTSL
jgi:hypothetical protein